MKVSKGIWSRIGSFAATTVLAMCTFYSASALNLANVPLFVTQGAEPLVMLNMSKDHQLYFKAYDDYSDVDGDGNADTTYKNGIDYYGYFDSYKCYIYSTTNARFNPVSETTDKYCNAGATTGQWSGNFLNWATMTRMDAVRKILYGGMRSTDTATDTVLERAYLPTDAHSFAKYYGGSDIAQLVGVTATSGTTQTSGITLCNTTYHASALSQNVLSTTNPPKIRLAIGNYSLWASNERWQCTWSGEHGASNGNNSTLSANPAYGSSPALSGSNREYNARVKVCVSGLIGRENCKSYPTAGAVKPVGLLQKYGDNNQVKFGLITGSYGNNKSGGVLRKNISYFSGEVNVTTNGAFVAGSGGIVDNLNKLRIYGYRHDDGTYFGTAGSDVCQWARSSFPNGECSNWGNPQSEIYLEALRYLGGKTATTAYSATDSSRISGLTNPAWQDPITNTNYCASANIIQFNASTSSYDGDDLAGASTVGLSNVNAATDAVGVAQGIHGNDYFVGESGASTNQLCTAKTVTSLSGVRGTCPDAPRLEGTYKIAGLAHYAHTNVLRNSPANTKKIKTYGVALSPAVPKVEIPVPGSSRKVTLLPGCRNLQPNPDANCAIVDFKIVSQTTSATVNTGKLYVNWEDSEQGGDYDQDMWGIIDYSVSATNVSVTTQVVAQSTGDAMGFGYIIGGTNDDGFHVHSGINGFTYAGAGTPVTFTGSGSPTTRTYTLGSSLARLLEQPLWYAAKWGGFADTNNDGTITSSTQWDSDANGTPDTYFYATNPAQLEVSLGKALDAVANEPGSASAVASNSTRLDGNTAVYQASFASGEWTGQLLAYSLTRAGVGGLLWNASSAGKIPAEGARDLFTYNPTNAAGSRGVSLAWANLSATQQAALRLTGEPDNVNAQRRLTWLRGGRADEQPIGILRRRTSIFGDIVNSDPVYSGAQNFRYDQLLPVAVSERSTYQAYVAAKAARRAVVFVGANDGFLHAINADSGEELFAYMPSSVFDKAAALATPGYGSSANPHQYYVDGPMFVGDAYINGSWRTLLVGSTGAGGKSIYVLDVSDPENFTAADVLFELNAADHPELGNVLGQPFIVRTSDGQWSAVFGNGYNSTGELAYLFVVDLENPTSVVKIPAGNAGSNGLSGPSLLNSLGTASTAFAGDLQGRMWKFDLSSTNPANWGVAHGTVASPLPLFVARGPNNEVQPITSAPTLGRNSQRNNELMVYFGTGQYLTANDNVIPATPPVQSVYAILDGAAITATNRSVLSQKVITTQTASTRTVTEGAIDWTNVRGWYMDLLNAGSATGAGERVISKPLLLFDRLLLTSFIPSPDPCSFGGTGWLMDVGGTGTNTTSLLGESGKHLDIAVLKISNTIKGGETSYLPMSDISGAIHTQELTNPPSSGGRMSWRQLR